MSRPPVSSVSEAQLPQRMRDAIAEIPEPTSETVSQALRLLTEACRASGRREIRLDDDSVARLCRMLEDRGATRQQIARRLIALRTYARTSGEGLDWSERTGRNPPDRYAKVLPQEFVVALDSMPIPASGKVKNLLLRMAKAAGNGSLVIDANSVAALVRDLSQEGYSVLLIRQSLSQLRRFARISGLGRQWAEATAAPRVEMRAADLPERMRLALQSDDIPLGDRSVVRTAVRRLAGVCLQRGLEIGLDHDSAEALEDALRQDGVSTERIGKILSSLRVYARATGEGLDWATQTGSARIPVRRHELPASMRDHLARMETTRRGVNGELPPIRTAVIVRTLRDLANVLRNSNRPIEITEDTIALYVAARRARRDSEITIKDSLTKLRQYAVFSGDGIDWALRSQHRIGIKVSDLPERTLRGLSSLGRSRTDGLPPLKRPHIWNITYSLRWLVKAARAVDGPDFLCDESFTNLTEYLLSQGYSQSFVEVHKYLLLTFAKYTGEGKKWAQGAYTHDVRPLSHVLAAPHWARLRRRAEALVQQGLRPRNLRLVDAFLKLPRQGGVVTEDAAAEFCEGRHHMAYPIFNTLKKLDPRSPDLHSLRVVLFEIHQKLSSSKPPRERESRRIVTVPFEALPDDIKTRLIALRAERVRGKPRYASKTLDCIEDVLSQLVFSARRRGLPESYNDSLLEAWFADINSRKIRAGYKRSLVERLIFFAQKANIDFHVIEKLKEDFEIYGEESVGEKKRKAEALLQRPVTLADVANAACSWSEAASSVMHAVPDDAWRRMWFGCAILAILVVRPLRSCDLRRLVVGETLIRNRHRWRLDLASSKTGEDLSGALPEELTPYIDGAILQGAVCSTQEEFEELYGRRVGSPLFSKPNGEGYSYAWLLEICVEAFGHSTHIPRTLHVSEAAGRIPEAMVAASRRLAHRNRKSKDEYLVKGDQAYLRAGDDALASEIEKLRRHHAASPPIMRSRNR